MIINRKIMALLGTTILAGISSGALAQSANPGNEPQAVEDTIIVTARGRQETLIEVPLSETVFDSVKIQDARIDQVDDFIALTPGVTIANSQDSGTNFITIRGMSQTRNGEPPVAVVVDDVLQVNARAFDQGLFDLQSIEVVRGPQGALYGRNATNGAIIIHTKAPTDTFEGYAQATVGRGNEYALEGSVSGPISGDKVSGRFSGRYYNRDGIFNNVFLNKKVDFSKEFNLRGHLHFNVSENFTADVRGSLTETDGSALNFTFQPVLTDPQTGFVSGFDFGRSSANLVQRDFSATNLGFDSRNAGQLSLRLNYDFGWGTFRSVSAYDSITQTTGGDQFPYSANSTINPGITFFDGTQTQYVDVEAFSQEFRLSSRDDQSVRWMFGAYYLDTSRFISSTTGNDLEQGIRRVQRNPFLGDAGNPTTSFIADDNNNTAWALFFNTAWDVTDKIELAFAGRYDEDERNQIVDSRQGAYDGTGAFLAAIGTPGAVNHKTFSKFQPKVTARYKASDDLSFYASWGQGFRSGQFNQNGVGSVAAGAGIAGIKDTLSQEDSTTYEAGFKSQFMGGRTRVSGAFYRTNVTNAPYFVFIGAVGAQVLVGIDKVEITGGEFELSTRLTEGLDAYVGLGISDSNIKTYNLNPAAVGNKAPYVPNSTINAGLQYRTPISNTLNLFGRVDYERRGKQYWDPENSTPRSRLDLVNVRAGVEDIDGKWSLIGSIDNLTDEVYNSEWVLGGFAHAASPRIWRLDFRVNF